MTETRKIREITPLKTRRGHHIPADHWTPRRGDVVIVESGDTETETVEIARLNRFYIHHGIPVYETSLLETYWTKAE